MPIVYAGNHWEKDEEHSSASEVAKAYNRLEGNNSTLKREVEGLKAERDELKAKLAESSPASASGRIDMRSFLIGALTAVAAILFVALIVAFGDDMADGFGGLMSTELTVGGVLLSLLLLVLLVVLAFVLFARTQRADHESPMAKRLGIYDRERRNNQESSDSDHSDNPGFLHKIGFRRAHRGGES